MDVALLGAGSHIPPKGFSRSHLCFSVRYPLKQQGLPQIRAWMWQSQEALILGRPSPRVLPGIKIRILY